MDGAMTWFCKASQNPGGMQTGSNEGQPGNVKEANPVCQAKGQGTEKQHKEVIPPENMTADLDHELEFPHEHAITFLQLDIIL